MEISFASVVVKEVRLEGSPATATPSIVVRAIRSRTRFRVDAETVRSKKPIALGPGRYDHASVDAALMFAARRLLDLYPLVDARPIFDAVLEAAINPQPDPDFLSAHDDPTVVRSPYVHRS